MNLLLILSFFSFAFAQNGNQSYTADVNQDGKIDFLEIFHENILIERREDLNFDGIYDRQTLFDPDNLDGYFKIITEKKILNKSSSLTRISFSRDDKLKRNFILTQVDRNGDGTWDAEFKNSEPIDSYKDDCDESNLIQFARDAKKLAHASNEFVNTSWGHRIHKSCLDQDNWFLRNSEKSIRDGLHCLKNLASLGGTGASKNATSLENLLKQKNVQIICNEDTYDWGASTVAYATTSVNKGKSVLTHPGISFNPKLFNKTQRGNKQDILLKRTLFHEQLHNLGYLHTDDIEYSYTCETCCFPLPDDKTAAVDAACKICSGNYDGTMDPSYLKDITTYGELNFSRSQALSTSLNFVKINPDKQDGLVYAAVNMTGFFDTVGPELAKLLRDSRKLNEDQLKILSRTNSYQDNQLHRTYASSSSLIAAAVYKSYSEQNPGAALETLRKNAPVIQAELRKRNPDPDSKYVVEGLKDVIKRVVFDVWINKFYGSVKDEKTRNSLDIQAYELAKIYGL